MNPKSPPILYGSLCDVGSTSVAGKKELRLPQMSSKLGKFSALIIDDLGTVQQSREEMEVLFRLIADRYEKTSILLSSNQPFSKWESFFKDPMTTAAVIDRLVHHSINLELNVPSFRLEQANQTRTTASHDDSP